MEGEHDRRMYGEPYLRFMVITVMVSLSNTTAADRYFFNQLFSHLASGESPHHYYICTDAPDEVHFRAANVTVLSIPSVNSKTRFFHLWRQVKHRRLLKKLGTEMALFMGARLYTHSPLPYCIWVRPEDMEAKPSRRLLKSFGQARSVLTVSEASKSDLCRQYGLLPERVHVVHAAADETFRPIDWEQQTVVKEKYTDGCEYFIYTGSFDDQKALINLLKAFSLFKKRQKTSWKLVMVNRGQHPATKFSEAMKSYKYRHDIVFLEEKAENLPALLGAAYAFVYPATKEGHGVYVLEAMSAGLPVVVPDTGMLRETVGEGGIYYHNRVEELAEKIMVVYKDEALRNRLIAKAKERSLEFSWERAAEEMGKGMRLGTR